MGTPCSSLMTDDTCWGASQYLSMNRNSHRMLWQICYCEIHIDYITSTIECAFYCCMLAGFFHNMAGQDKILNTSHGQVRECSLDQCNYYTCVCAHAQAQRNCQIQANCSIHQIFFPTNFLLLQRLLIWWRPC